MKQVTPEDMMSLQEDNFNQKAADILPFMLDSLDATQLKGEANELYDLLRDWNLQNDRNLRAPSVFAEWWSQFKQALWDEMSGQDALVMPTDAATIHMMQYYPQDTMVDRMGTTYRETLNDLLNESFTATVQELNDWPAKHGQGYLWKNYQATSIQHMLRLAPLGFYDVPIGGGKGIVNATSDRHGPSWRMVVELGDPVQVWGVYPGGQSGNPGSPYYGNMVDAWANGEHYPMQFLKSPFAKEAAIMTSQTLYPSDSE